jgi:hypothetical protein
MRKIAALAGAFVVIALIGLAATVFLLGQRPAYAWRPSVATREVTAHHLRVLIDEAHHNASTVGLFGRYLPFARLLQANGYAVVRNTEPFMSAMLARGDVLVVANAAGAGRLQFWGFNLPLGAEGDRGAPAFSSAEIDLVRAWVEDGGSLLLIADHQPFGTASADLAAAFGVTMNGGSVEVPNAISDPLAFERKRGALGNHPTLAGVDRVMTFTGQSLDGPQNAVILLRLPENAIEFVATSEDDAGTTTFEDQPAGAAQALALEYGAGRLVVLGEAAMFTAQVSAGQPFGLNTPGSDNEVFARNVMRWLARAE